MNFKESDGAIGKLIYVLDDFPLVRKEASNHIGNLHLREYSFDVRFAEG